MREIVAVWQGRCDKDVGFSLFRQPGAFDETLSRKRTIKTNGTWPTGAVTRRRPFCSLIRDSAISVVKEVGEEFAVQTICKPAVASMANASAYRHAILCSVHRGNHQHLSIRAI